MTNPDNVGGLPERWRGLADKCEAEFPQKAQIFRWCANELCRAASAGGVLDGSLQHKLDQELDSAPAGSGEGMAKCLEAIAEVREPLHGWHRGTLHKAAALLRKRQQGADEGRSRAYDQVDRFLRNNLGDEAYAEYSEALEVACGYAASQGQEGGNDA